LFVALEGVDGAGKSTQAQLLRKFFEARGRRVLTVREPGGTKLGEELRRIILDPESGDLGPEVDLLLFMAARAQLCREEIAPALERGDVVLSDRFLCSSVVYQGIVGGLGIENVLAVGSVATRGVEPDLSVVLDVDPARAHSKLDAGDRMELRGVEFQKQVREGFRALAEKFPAKIAWIDGHESVEQVHASIVAELESRFGLS